MKPLLALVAAGALALPSLASDPSRVKTTRIYDPTRRTLRGLPPPRPPWPWVPAPAPETLASRFAKAGFWPGRLVAELLAEPVVCWHRQRQARGEFDPRLWMNNQQAERP